MSPSLLRMAGDERLARMVTAGHDHAFATLYDRYRDVLVRYCRSLVRDDQDALDAFQSTMLNALRALRDDRRRAPVRPWLFRIAHNESISVLRRRPLAEPLDDRQPAGVDVHRTAEDREALAGLLEDLGALTEHQRSALLLRELGGLAYDDVAGVLDTTPLAARQAVFAARASLHDQREGRELGCALVQRRLSDADRRAARTRAVRAHLRGCEDCRGFASAIGRRRAAILLPLPPALASSGLLVSILDGAGAPATAGGGAVTAGVVAKAAVALSAAVVATGAAERPRPAPAPAKSAAAAKAVAPAPARTATATTARRATTSTAPTVARSGPVQLASVLPAADRSAPQRSTPERGTAQRTTPERPAVTPALDGEDLPREHHAPAAWRDPSTAMAVRPHRRHGEGATAPTPVPEPAPAATTTAPAPTATTAAPAETTTAAPADTAASS